MTDERPVQPVTRVGFFRRMPTGGGSTANLAPQATNPPGLYWSLENHRISLRHRNLPNALPAAWPRRC